MPWTVVGYSESQDSAVLVNIAALADPHVRVEGDNVVVPPDLSNLLAEYAVGISITRAQLVSPSLRRVFPYEIVPIDRGADEPSSGLLLNDHFTAPVPLTGDEALNALGAEDGTGATRSAVLVVLGSGPIEAIRQPIFTIRATASVTLTANTWINAGLTLDQTLPAGRYQLVGARFESVGLVAFRFVFPGFEWRPGGLGVDAASDLLPPGQRRGGWGVWGEFRHNTPPTVDFWSISADTSETGQLDLVSLGA